MSWLSWSLLLTCWWRTVLCMEQHIGFVLLVPPMLHFQVVFCLQEDDVIGVLSSKDISQLKPLGDRILIQARADIHPSPHLYSIKSLSGMSEGTCMMLLRLKGPLHRQPPSSPLGQHLLWRPCYCVQVADAGDTSEGGILLTTGSKEQPTLGKVRACTQHPLPWHIQSVLALH